MKGVQKIQEDQYVFPYHYLVDYDPVFTQSKSWQWGINYAATLELVILMLKPDRFRTIIDIGTGDGRLVYKLSEKYPKKEVIGIDYSKRAIDMAKSLHPKGNYICKDISRENINIKADAVTLIEVIEHIPPKQLEGFIASVSKLLKKSSKIFITVPHVNIPVQEKHYQHFNTSGLKNLFMNDFKIENVKYLGKQGVNYQVILKILQNDLFILNNKSLLNLVYKYYKKYIFFCDELDCSRIFLELRKK